MSISDLVARFRESGDRDLLNEIITALDRVVRAKCWSRFPTPRHHQLVEDLTQESLLSVAQNLRDGLRDPKKVLAWARGIARNACNEHGRKTAGRIRVETLAADPVCPSSGASATEAHDRQDLIGVLLERLGPRHAEVLLLRHGVGQDGPMSYREIGCVFEVSKEAAQALVEAAERAARLAMHELGESDS